MYDSARWGIGLCYLMFLILLFCSKKLERKCSFKNDDFVLHNALHKIDDKAENFLGYSFLYTNRYNHFFIYMYGCVIKKPYICTHFM